MLHLRMAATRRLSAIAGHTRGISTKTTMKEAVVSAGPKVTIRDAPIPTPGPHQVVTQVVCSGSNPKDWKRAETAKPDAPPLNQGDDIAGYVHAVGDNVIEFRPGDRVAAFHEMLQPGGSYAEYATSWAHTTFPLPEHTSFEEGAAIPLAAMTAAVGLFARLGLPEPWRPAREPVPLIIYGAAGAVGSYAIQLARRANIHPLICVAGRGTAHVEGLIDRAAGDTIVDYREGDEAVVRGLQDAVKKSSPDGKVVYAFDTVSKDGSYTNICKVLDPTRGKITFVLPSKNFEGIPEGVQRTQTTVGSVHGTPDDLKDFGFVHYRYIGLGLAQGWFKPHPQEVVPGGLEGVEQGLTNLKQGRASAVKYVFRIADTPGLGHSN